MHNIPNLEPGHSDHPMTLYTIGHSNLSAEAFEERLQRHKITTLVDVRSAPVSKYVPHFNKSALQATLPQCGVTYRYAGKYLGGRPDDPALLTDGKPDYLKMMRTPDYVRGIVRLLNIIVEETGFVAIMCAEKDPLHCHRHHLIARSLIDPAVSVIEGAINLTVQHIDAEGELMLPVSPADFAGDTDAIEPQQPPLF